jgi:hypothetical protein
MGRRIPCATGFITCSEPRSGQPPLAMHAGLNPIFLVPGEITPGTS